MRRFFTQTFLKLEGQCGATVTWKIENNILYLQGSGSTYDFTDSGFQRYSNFFNSINIGEGITILGNNLFSYCFNFTQISLPKTLTTIKQYVFSNCTNLQSITIPNNVTNIQNYSFRQCVNLKTLIFEDGAKTINIGYNNIIAGFSEYTSLFQDCNFESVYMGRNISINYKRADVIIRTKKLTISNQVTKILSDFCFSDDLVSLVIPNSVTSIGASAFYGCSRLTSVTIPNSVTSIGESAFHNTAWYDNLSDGVVYINDVLYEYKGTMPSGTSIEIKEGTVSISPYAFEDCSGLTSVTIPNSVTSIGESAFGYCHGLKEVHISDLSAWCKIGFGNYYSNPLNYAKHLFLDGEEIKDLVIPNSVTSIGASAFYRCSGLTSLVIPASVVNIQNIAFRYCSGLTEIICEAVTPPTITSSSFSNIDTSIPLYVPAGSVDTYKSTSYWSKFTNIQAIVN